MFFLFRMGRYAARSGGRRGPQGQPQKAGLLGWTFAALLFAGCFKAYPGQVIAVLIALAVMTVILAVAVRVRRKAPERDPLDDLMNKCKNEEEAKR